MNEAIRLAIEKGGYVNHAVSWYEGKIMLANRLEYQIALDPKFWPALGKALGWDDKVTVVIPNIPNLAYNQDSWLYYGLKYTELALTGGDTEKFWKALF